MQLSRAARRGFTLIEILIVVVVIGVLAALILPRFMAAPEKAMISEANQMIGSIMRAQATAVDTAGGVFVTTTSASNATTWGAIGMAVPGNARFGYNCTSPTCSAFRVGTTTNYVSLTALGVWSCGGTYASMPNGGCKATV